MAANLEIMKLLLSEDVEKKIEENLTKIKNTNDLSLMNLELSAHRLSLENFSIEYLEQLRIEWGEIAELSVNLFTNFDFFKQFCFRTRYKTENYENGVRKLGYILNGDLWSCSNLPDKQIVIENVFYFCFFQFLLMAKNQKLQQEQLIKENYANNIIEIITDNTNIQSDGFNDVEIMNENCEFCGSEIINGICSVCKADWIEDIERKKSDDRKFIKSNNVKNDLFGAKNTNFSDNEIIDVSNKFDDSNIGNLDDKKDFKEMNYAENELKNIKKYSSFHDYHNQKKDRKETVIKKKENLTYHLYDSTNLSLDSEENNNKTLVRSNLKPNTNLFDNHSKQDNNKTFEIEDQILNESKPRKYCEDKSYNTRIIYSMEKSNKFISIDNKPYLACQVCSYKNYNLAIYNCIACMSFQSTKKIENLNISETEGTIENKIKNNNFENQNWSCIDCTYINVMSDNICQVCFSLKSKPFDAKLDSNIEVELPEETWLCKGCKANNSFDRFRCIRCKEMASFVNKWRCEKCSFFNDKLSKNCSVCESHNKHLMKCGHCKKVIINKQCDKVCPQCDLRNDQLSNISTNDQCNNSYKNTISDKTTRNENLSNMTTIEQSNNSDKTTTNKYLYDISTDCQYYNSYKSKDEQLCLKQPIKNNDKIFKTDVDQRNKNQIETTNQNSNSYNTNVNIKKLSDKELSRNNDNNKTNLPSNNKNISVEVVKDEISNEALNKKATERINKTCKKCKIKLSANDNFWCSECALHRWFCNNEACNGINFKRPFCTQCKVRKDSKLSNCTNFIVYKDNKEIQMWQCSFCMQFTNGTLQKCKTCSNLRDGSGFKKCSCNWNNKVFKTECEKCNKQMK